MEASLKRHSVQSLKTCIACNLAQDPDDMLQLSDEFICPECCIGEAPQAMEDLRSYDGGYMNLSNSQFEDRVAIVIEALAITKYRKPRLTLSKEV